MEGGDAIGESSQQFIRCLASKLAAYFSSLVATVLLEIGGSGGAIYWTLAGVANVAISAFRVFRLAINFSIEPWRGRAYNN